MNQIKIYDVAGAAGVSLATVSRVLNHPEKVRPETRAKIERIIKELGYKPNLNAKGLASSKSTTVAVVVPELTRSSVAEMINGIADCARKRGYLLRLFVNNLNREAATIQSERELWGDVMASGVDGVLYINDEITEEHLDILSEVSVDVVLTNTVCKEPSFPSVAIDYKKAAYDITKEMINRGNKKIWMITTIRKYMVNDLKVEGYLKAMSEAGLEPHVLSVSGKTELNVPAYEEALKAFQAGLKCEDTSLHQSLRYNEAIAYEFLADFDTAKKLMAAYLKDYPNDETAKREYEFLKTR